MAQHFDLIVLVDPRAQIDSASADLTPGSRFPKPPPLLGNKFVGITSGGNFTCARRVDGR
jgi:hypothetical protein